VTGVRTDHADLRVALELVRDRQAIHDVLMLYCRGVDRCDEDIVRAVYHADSYDDHGYWRGNGHDFAAFVTNRLREANSSTTHSVSNVLVELDGDRAVSESQVVATLVRRATPEAPVTADVMAARYHDRFARIDGVWKIAHRVVVLDWHKTETWESANAPVPLDDFARGGRRPQDPVYALLGRVAPGPR
jgi:hypothetical protein